MVCWFHFVSMVTRTCIELAYTACFSKHCFVTAEFKIVISPADCGVWTHPHFYTDLRPCQRLLLTLAVDPHISIAFAYSFITSPCVRVRVWSACPSAHISKTGRRTNFCDVLSAVVPQSSSGESCSSLCTSGSIDIVPMSDNHRLRPYDTRCCYNVQSKADMSQLNLPHGTNN